MEGITPEVEKEIMLYLVNHNHLQMITKYTRAAAGKGGYLSWRWKKNEFSPDLVDVPIEHDGETITYTINLGDIENMTAS